MNREDILTAVIPLVILVALVLGASYGSYKYGRTAERRLLYGVLVEQLELAYIDGYNDGLGKGRTKGWADAMKEVDTSEPLFSGRY